MLVFVAFVSCSKEQAKPPVSWWNGQWSKKNEKKASLILKTVDNRFIWTVGKHMSLEFKYDEAKQEFHCTEIVSGAKTEMKLKFSDKDNFHFVTRVVNIKNMDYSVYYVRTK